MPRLVTLLPCEKVIVDRDGMPSLIALFEHINISVSQGEEIVEVPKETVTYHQWAVFSEWKVEEDEIATVDAADQILEVQFPDGSVAPIKGRLRFVFNSAGIHRNHQNILGFPIGQQGTYKIRVWLEKDGKPISEIAIREMKVIHKLPPGVEPKQVFGASPA
ncbi:MAG: hypothetical protein WCA49_06105 [Candidatus Sulfotelmatobacter sp.]